MTNRLSSDHVQIRATALGRTTAAVRVRVDGEMVWLPRSSLEDLGECVDEALRGRVFMPVVELSVAAWKARELKWT